MPDDKLPVLVFNIYRNDNLIRTERLQQEVIKIGKAATSHICIDDDDLVSKMHVVIDVKSTDGEIELIDLGSASGTFVNGKKINKCYLQKGDQIQIGNTKLVVDIDTGEAVESVNPEILSGGQDRNRPSTPPVQPQQAPVSQMPPAFNMGVPFQSYSQPASSTATPESKDPFERIFGDLKPDVGGLVDVSSLEGMGDSLEIVSAWNGSVLSVKHVKPGDKSKGLYGIFSIGEDPNCDMQITIDELGGQERFAVVDSDGGMWTVNILPTMSGVVTFPDGTRQDVEEIMRSKGGSGAYKLNVQHGMTIKLDLGENSWFIHTVKEGRIPKAPLNIDWGIGVYGAIALLFHMVTLFLVYFIPPDPQSLSLDMLAEDNRFVRYILEPPEIQQEEVPEWTKSKEEDSGGKGMRHKGEEGQMGNPNAPNTGKRFGIKGPAENTNPRMAREEAKSYAMSSGILSLLQSAAPTSPFGADSALGADPENALGLMMGNEIGDSFGYGGLGLRGTGRGGGGMGEGTIGLGNLATIGHGGGGGSGQGYGKGAGGIKGRKSGGVSVRSGEANVRGALAKEVIRRYIHQHMNEIRFCYEQKLRSRPDLAGRVAVRFIISPDGTVSSAIPEGSQTNLGDPEVEGCVARAVSRIVFPSPEGGGVVIVTYPFVFQPAE